MHRLLSLSGVMFLVAPAPAQENVARELKNPASIAIGADGKVYVSVRGEADKPGNGAIFVINKGKAAMFADGLDQPLGVAAFQKWLFVADKQRVWRIDQKGKAQIFADASAFPSPPHALHDITVDPESNGLAYVSDAGDGKG